MFTSSVHTVCDEVFVSGFKGLVKAGALRPRQRAKAVFTRSAFKKIKNM